MRICIVSTLFHAPWGGSEVLWARMAHEALDRGHEVALVLKRWPETPEPVRALQAQGAKVFLRSVDLRRRWSRAFEYRVHPFPSIIRWAPEAVLVSEGGLYEVMYRNDIGRLLQALGVPYTIVCQQVYDFQFPIGGERFREALISFHRDARRVAFVAEWNRTVAERQLATRLTNGCVVRNPTNLDGHGMAPWPSGPTMRLASVGRLEVNDKGQDIVLECLAGEPWKSRDWGLSFYGQGRDQTYLANLARLYGIADRVTFCGHTGDVRAVWEDNHLNIMASRSEGTPLALVEAMLCGRPSVVSDVGGNLEWVAEPRNGFIAEAPTVRSFGAALERAWAARAGWEAMGTAAYHDALGLIDPAPAETLLKLVIDPDRIDRDDPATEGPMDVSSSEQVGQMTR
jgi:glycosyltransferase involved in cell wall biosynthesis